MSVELFQRVLPIRTTRVADPKVQKIEVGLANRPEDEPVFRDADGLHLRLWVAFWGDDGFVFEVLEERVLALPAELEADPRQPAFVQAWAAVNRVRLEVLDDLSGRAIELAGQTAWFDLPGPSWLFGPRERHPLRRRGLQDARAMRRAVTRWVR